jgi:uncharacterized membrane protein
VQDQDPVRPDPDACGYGNTQADAAFGGAFALGTLLFYLAAGFGITALIAATGTATPFQALAGAVVLFVGLLGIVAGMLSRPTFPPIVPRASHDMIRNWIETARTAGPGFMLVLGGVIGFVELPVTAGGYLGVLGLLAGYSLAETMPLLALYNLLFTLPLLLIVAAVAMGLEPAALEAWRKDRRRLVRGVTGVVLVALGFVLLVACGFVPMLW